MMLFVSSLLLLFLSLFDFGFSITSCPDHSFQLYSNCFIFVSKKENFEKAEKICIEKGGHLISIHDAFVNNILATTNHFPQGSESWIGGSQKNNTWKWTDKTPFDYTDWKKGEPKNGTQKCISFSVDDGYWKSEDCSELKTFTCNVALEGSEISTTTKSASLPTQYPGNCSNEWIYFEKTNSCYNFLTHHGPKQWQEAEDMCKSFKAHLTSIHSDEENAFLFEYGCTKENSNWVGLYTTDNGTTWKWTDNSLVDYLPWASEQPNYSAGSCTNFDGFCDGDGIGGISVERCTEYFLTICKKGNN